MREAGIWHHQAEVSGTQTTAQLKLSPYVNYSFRVMAENSIGRSVPSEASEQYLTKAAGKVHHRDPTERRRVSHSFQSQSLLMCDGVISRTRSKSHGRGRTRNRAWQLGDYLEGEPQSFPFASVSHRQRRMNCFRITSVLISLFSYYGKIFIFI